MIIDKISNAHLYKSIGPNVAAALDYIENNELKVGERFSLNDGAASGGAMPYTGKPAAECRAENHATMVDIHVAIEGVEVVGYCDLSRATPKPDQDMTAESVYYDADLDYIRVQPGYFFLVLPGDVHATKIMDGEPKECIKAIIKAKL